MANSVSAPSVTTAKVRVAPAAVPLGTAPTYYYRTSGGTRGSTSAASAIPVGAVLERVA